MEVLKNQITNKAGFLIYTDYWEKYFSKMTGEQVKEVFKIVFHFNLTFEILTTDDLAVEMVVATIIDNLKRDAMKRAKQSIASAENGKLGGRPKKKAKRKQKGSKSEANVNVNEECILELKLESQLPIFINKDLFDSFVEMRNKIKKPLTDKAKELLLKDLTNFENLKAGNANIALENSIKNSWQGVFEPKIVNNNQQQQPKQNNYYKKDDEDPIIKEIRYQLEKRNNGGNNGK